VNECRLQVPIGVLIGMPAYAWLVYFQLPMVLLVNWFCANTWQYADAMSDNKKKKQGDASQTNKQANKQTMQSNN
jgi:hypothetical protein